MTWRRARIGILVVVLACAVGLLALRVGILRGIGTISDHAMAAYPGNPDRVMALVSLVADEDQPVSDRDRAVWALGQLRDSRALPVLWTYAKDGECRHGVELCRKELAKAIALCEDPGPDVLRIATR
jgi:hypothetical protein